MQESLTHGKVTSRSNNISPLPTERSASKKQESSRGVQLLVKVYNSVIDYILPQRCLGCSEILNSNGEFCSDCWKKLEFIARPYCSIYGQRFSIKVLDNCICGRCYSSKPNYDSARSLLNLMNIVKK